MSVLKLLRAEALAVRADLQPGDHCRLLIAGPLILKKPSPAQRKPLTELAMRVAYWSEPNPTCPTCGSDV